MFDISFGELLLVVVLAVVFIGPKDLPLVVRAVAKTIFKLKQFLFEIKGVMRDLAREAGVDDIKREMEDEFSRDIKMIKGDDGEWYEAYEMRDFPHDTPEKNLPLHGLIQEAEEAASDETIPRTK